MKRLTGFLGALLIGFLLFVPVALAADPLPHTGRVLISTTGDVTIPAGQHADVVVVVDGTATIQGEVNTIVVIDGRIDLLGARTETVFAVRSPVEIGPGSVVLGDVMQFDSPVHRTGDAQVQGQIGDLAARIVGFGALLGPALVLIWMGFGLATIVAGLVLAGLAARQVRDAETLISREPVMTLITGILGLVLVPVVAIALIATLIGAPLGVGILLMAWPFVAFIGYLVAGIWVGDWVLRRTEPLRSRERPYLAAAIGLVILGVVSVVPVLTVVVMVLSVFGFGAVLLLALRTLVSRATPQPGISGAVPTPIAG